MNLDVYNTHIELYPYSKGDYPIIEDIYTAVDSFSQRPFPCGYLIDNNKLYLPRGTNIEKLENISKIKANYNNESDPISKMSKKFSSIFI